MTATSEIKKTVKIPDEVEVEITGRVVKVRGPKGENSKEFFYPGIKINKKNDEIEVTTDVLKKTQRAIIGTFASHLNNMITGVTEGFEYKLKITFAHFPTSVKVSEGQVLVENFLGEKVPRKAKIKGDCQVIVKGDEVIVQGINLEDVGQTAANIEHCTVVKRKDRRVFQDGIHLIEKNGIPLRR